MRTAKIAAAFLLPLFLASLCFSQSLAEIARQERERREALKGKKAVVVTNADLAKMKKKPALEIPPVEPAPEGGGATVDAPPSPESQPAAEPVAPAAASEPVSETGPPAETPESGASQQTLQELQARWEKAREYVELLTIKMGALWQEYYGQQSLTAREALQQSISETFLKLEKAQEEETRARRELERFINQQKKESAPALWIR